MKFKNRKNMPDAEKQRWQEKVQQSIRHQTMKVTLPRVRCLENKDDD